jgi:hypothetical protein
MRPAQIVGRASSDELDVEDEEFAPAHQRG